MPSFRTHTLFLRPRAIFSAAALAALSLAVVPRSAQAQTFTFDVGSYASPDFTNSNGTYSFFESGVSSNLILTLGMSQTFLLDGATTASENSTPTNSTPPGVFTGTAASNITFSEGSTSLGTQSLADDYTLDGMTTESNFASFTGGAPLTFTTTEGEQLVITPVASTEGPREATALLSPAAAPAVPEPSSFALLGLGLLSVGLVARRKIARG